MLRAVGTGLILCGGLLARQTLTEPVRRAQRTRLALAAALEAMEAEVRLLLTPMPTLLRRAAEKVAFFGDVLSALSSAAGPREAWRMASDALPLSSEERELLAALGERTGGDEEHACAALTLTASRLRRRYDEIESSRRQTEKLTTSLCVSASLLLAILLL